MGRLREALAPTSDTAIQEHQRDHHQRHHAWHQIPDQEDEEEEETEEPAVEPLKLGVEQEGAVLLSGPLVSGLSFLRLLKKNTQTRLGPITRNSQGISDLSFPGNWLKKTRLLGLVSDTICKEWDTIPDHIVVARLGETS